MRVRLSADAEYLLLAELRRLQVLSPTAAQRLEARLAQALRRLAVFPQSGRIVPEYRDPDLREVIVAPYRFFYVVRDDVWIIAVWHGRQDVAVEDESSG